MTPMHLLAVFAENKPSQTARITQILAQAGVNIDWVTIASSGSFGVMKFLVDKRDQAAAALKAKGLMVSLLEALAVEVENKPGGLQRVADLLGRHNLNLDNCSGFVANNRAILIIEAHDLTQAREILQKNGLRVLTQEELQGL
ncbi:MAG TPA: hypothetical protein VMU04_20855 [Candidatus Acidoferrum sp.]|nr:hypothetical protein [Candidatus Acidoferrum sp.]